MPGSTRRRYRIVSVKQIPPKSKRKRKPPSGPVLISTGEGGSLRIWARDDEIETDNPVEGRRVLRRLDSAGFRIFTTSKLKRVVSGLGASHFEGTLAARRLVRIRLDDGPVIYGTRSVLKGNAESFRELSLLWDFCQSYGAVFGSASWTSEQLLRSTLDQRLRFHAPVGRKGARGARKSYYAEGTYSHVDYVDIRSAYPSSMISDPVPSELVYQPGPSIDYPVGIALADVTIPEDSERYPPLYELARFGMIWKTGSVRGWYPLRELRMARDAGCRVEPDLVYRGENYLRPFDDWHRIMMEARALPGAAGRLGKIIANTLWGTFANGSETMVVRFADDRGEKIDLSSVRVRRPPPPEASFISVEIAARVRERIFRELVPSQPIYVDTDGGIIRRERPLPPGTTGSGIGEWSVRDRFEKFELVGIGAYIGHRYNGTKSVVLSGHEGIASTVDVRQHGASGGGTVVADSAREGWKGAKLRDRVPWVFDAEGRPVSLEYQWPLDQLPGDWSVIPQELAGLRDFGPVRVSELRNDPQAFPIPYEDSVPVGWSAPPAVSRVDGSDLPDPF